MSKPLPKRFRQVGVNVGRMAEAAGVKRSVVTKVKKAAEAGDPLASYLLLWAADEVSRRRTGFGLQTEVSDFCPLVAA